ARPFAAPGGILLALAEPDEVRWFREGRPASRAEAEAAIASGLPALERLAAEEGPEALGELVRATARARCHLPAPGPGPGAPAEA
ncbi:MAG TPA: hypothetical protein VFR34_04345, partial [Paracoccaceae bacterium]|nr:hypothetical protein [Paracoccaceae bacterium]